MSETALAVFSNGGTSSCSLSHQRSKTSRRASKAILPVSSCLGCHACSLTFSPGAFGLLARVGLLQDAAHLGASSTSAPLH